jgi:hypothetical protein
MRSKTDWGDSDESRPGLGIRAYTCIIYRSFPLPSYHRVLRERGAGMPAFGFEASHTPPWFCPDSAVGPEPGVQVQRVMLTLIRD